LAIASLNVATRLLFGAIVPTVFTVIVGAAVSTVIAKTAETSLTLPAASVTCAVISCTEPANKSISKVKLPPLFAVTLADEDDSGSSNRNNLTKETSGLTISGTAEANATVELFNGTTSLGTVTANSGGNFTLDIDLLAGSVHEITAQATDAAGNVSDV
jgi:molybdopterin-binding protein